MLLCHSCKALPFPSLKPSFTIRPFTQCSSKSRASAPQSPPHFLEHSSLTTSILSNSLGITSSGRPPLPSEIKSLTTHEQNPLDSPQQALIRHYCDLLSWPALLTAMSVMRAGRAPSCSPLHLQGLADGPECSSYPTAICWIDEYLHMVPESILHLPLS